jgi:hypothetical protein
VGTLITVTGTQAATATAGVSGTYTVPGLPNGNYVVTPTKAGYAFTPPSLSVTISGADVPNVSFTAALLPTYNVSGSVTAAGAGAVLTLSGSPSVTVVANGGGAFSIANLPPGSYTLTPRKTGFTFSPLSLPVTIAGADVSGLSFTATAGPPQTLSLPDLSYIIPGSSIAIVGTGSTREFQYTHLTFNSGPGPLVSQPQYSPTSGNFQGPQYLYRRDGTTWFDRAAGPDRGRIRVPCRARHFHYPFASYVSQRRAERRRRRSRHAEHEIGFCIADSYIFDPYLPNAGDLGGLGSCSDPLSLRGLDIGAVDEYDRTDDGQSIVIGNLADGTYWLRAFVDPDNFLTEADESNNETDVRIRITGNDVQVLETVIPVLPPLPAITLDAPADQAVVSGTVNLVASTPVTTGVQFLLDGLPLGGPVPTAPYSFPWSSWTVPDGVHWLAAKTTDGNGRTNTSAIVTVTVANSAVQDTVPPTVVISDPDEGEVVSSIVALGATVQDNKMVASVRFYVDGLAVGDPITTPPYLVSWNTLTEADGPHTVTATAIDGAGLMGTSPPVDFIVDNSHPPDLIQGRAGLRRRHGRHGDGAVLERDRQRSAGGVRLVRRPAIGRTDRDRERSRAHVATAQAQQRAARHVRDLGRAGHRQAHERDRTVATRDGELPRLADRDRVHALRRARRRRAGECTVRSTGHLPAGRRGGLVGVRGRQRLGSCHPADLSGRSGHRPPAPRNSDRRHVLGAIDGRAVHRIRARQYPRYRADERSVELRRGRGRRDASQRHGRRAARRRPRADSARAPGHDQSDTGRDPSDGARPIRW